MEEGRGGKEKKRRTTREEDRRWQRLPWPGPHTSSMEPNYEAARSQRFGVEGKKSRPVQNEKLYLKTQIDESKIH